MQSLIILLFVYSVNCECTYFCTQEPFDIESRQMDLLFWSSIMFTHLLLEMLEFLSFFSFGGDDTPNQVSISRWLQTWFAKTSAAMLQNFINLTEFTTLISQKQHFCNLVCSDNSFHFVGTPDSNNCSTVVALQLHF